MDWLNKSWLIENEEFAPKRKVNNKLSWKMPHIIGAFYSYKLNKVIEYESLGECLFYYLLELSKSVIQYYVQPVEVKQYYFDDDGIEKEWVHVPDVLVFNQGFVPHLYQIKDKQIDNEMFNQINKSCSHYAEKRHWKYSVIYPKKMSDIIIRNIEFLNGYMKKRKHYDEWIPELIFRLNVLQQSSIINLAKSFLPHISHPYILPAIYYLIAWGIFYTSFTDEICSNSTVIPSNNINFLEDYLTIEEGEINEKKFGMIP